MDPRDEGSHCIEQATSKSLPHECEAGALGPNGWCWTSKAAKASRINDGVVFQERSVWGKCSDGCPLTGQEKAWLNVHRKSKMRGLSRAAPSGACARAAQRGVLKSLAFQGATAS